MGRHHAPKSLLLALLLAAPFGLHAEDDPEDQIKYRKNVMKATGGHMGAMAAIIQGKVGHRDHLLYHAQALAAISRDVHGLFPEGSDFGDTRALDAVWQKRDAFKRAAVATGEKSEALLKAIQAGDAKAYAARFEELSDTCKSCHKDFRREE